MNQLRQSCLVERAWALASANPGLHFWPPLSSCVNATPEWQLSSGTAYPTLLHAKPVRHYVRVMSLKLHQHSSVSFWGKKGLGHHHGVGKESLAPGQESRFLQPENAWPRLPCSTSLLSFHLSLRFYHLGFKRKITLLFPTGSYDDHRAKHFSLGLCSNPGLLTFYLCVFKKLSFNFLTFK